MKFKLRAGSRDELPDQAPVKYMMKGYADGPTGLAREHMTRAVSPRILGTMTPQEITRLVEEILARRENEGE